jgi:hypothetical protein
MSANSVNSSTADLMYGFQPSVSGNISVSDIYEYSNTNTHKYIDSKVFNADAATTFTSYNIRNAVRTTSAITSIKFELATGSFNGGTVELYGVN